MSIAFFEGETTTTSLTSIRHNFETIFGELFSRTDTRNNNKNEDEILFKVTATFELKRESRNVDVSLRLTRPETSNDLEHHQQLPLTGAMAIINILQKNQNTNTVEVPKSSKTLLSLAEPSSLQWTEFIAHVGDDRLKTKIVHLKRKERNIFESIFEIISTEHSYIQVITHIFLY